MRYPAEIAAAAYRELEKARTESARETERNRARVFAAVPQAEALTRELSRTSALLARAILSGSDVEKKVAEIREQNLAGQEKLRELLRENGFADTALDDVHRCSVCHDTGVAPDGTVCACVRETEKRLMRERFDKSANCVGKDFDSFDLTLCAEKDRPLMGKILRFCTDYAAHFSPAAESLLLIGAPGLGKTHLSLAIGFAVIEKGFNVLYAPYHRLFGRLEDARFGHSEEEYARVMREILESELLILDDVGTELASSFSASVLYEIINTRMVEGRPTIISTNLTEAEITERYRERIHSRLFGAYRKVPFVGEDMRLRKH